MPARPRVAIAALTLLLTTPAVAQVTTADIVGRVNTPSFANPINTLGAPGFGSINSIGNSIPRQMQFAVKLLF